MHIVKKETDCNKQLADLYSGLRYNLVIDSILDGNTPGWIFTNQYGPPRVAIMWNRMDALLLAIDQISPKDFEELKSLLRDEIIPDAITRGIPELTLFCEGKHYQNAIALVEGLDFCLARRRFYHFDKPKIVPFELLSDKGQIMVLNQEFFRKEYLANMEKVIGWVLSFWESLDIFLERGFGFCVLSEGEIASWCLSVYASGMHYELGLETISLFRKRGLGTIAAALAVEYCFQKGFVPHWHCWNDNLGSIAIAQKIGFKRSMGYQVIRISL